MRCSQTISCFLLVLSMLSSHFLTGDQAPRPQELDSTTLKRLDGARVLQLYQMMKDIDELLMFHHIPYYINRGTLLGAVRHKGFIPWDEDLDIDVDVYYEQKLLSLMPYLKLLGYGIVPMWFGYKVYLLTGQEITGKSYRFPFLDIFLTKMKNNKIFYARTSHVGQWGRREGEPIFIKQEELYPRKRYTFGLLQILGPHDPLPFLTCLYGSDWDRVAAYWYDHQIEKWLGVTKVMLAESDRVPAQPLGPLEDRVAALVHDYPLLKQSISALDFGFHVRYIFWKNLRD